MRFWAGVGAIFCFLSVGLGAFAAHALEDVLTAYGRQVWQTGIQYHQLHGLALVALGFLPLSDKVRPRVGGSWAVGILIFSGSLYLLAVSGIRWLGAITPIGGICFLAGWAMLAVDLFRRRETQ